MIVLKQYILNDYIKDDVRMVNPMMEINGFKVRPGFFDLNGASEFSCGVNFTVHTSNGTSCDLLLFHPGEEEPYAIIPFPESYKIGDVYSMIVYDLKSEDFEYAYRVDGPYDEQKGLLFDKTKVLLDPYAQAVAGQEGCPYTYAFIAVASIESFLTFIYGGLHMTISYKQEDSHNTKF